MAHDSSATKIWKNTISHGETIRRGWYKGKPSADTKISDSVWLEVVNVQHSLFMQNATGNSLCETEDQSNE